MAIRWRKQDQLKLSNAVRKFNAAITREEKKNPYLVEARILPQRLNVEDLKQNVIGSRKDYNVVINRINRFFKKGARDIITDESGFKITKYEKNEIRYAAQRATQKRRNFRKKLGITETGAKMADLEDINVKSKQKSVKERLNQKIKNNNTDFENEKQGWDNFVRNVYERSSDKYYEWRNSIYMQNFYAAAIDQFNVQQALEIKELIESLEINPNQLFAMSQYDDVINIEYEYGAHKTKEKFEQIMAHIPKTYQEMKEGGLFE